MENKKGCFGNWSLVIGHWALGIWAYMEQCNDLLE